MDRLFFIETYGCQMNISDSEIISSIMIKNNYIHTDKIEDAEIIFINTCSVRDHAEKRIRSRLREFRSLKNKKPETIVGILGCMAERVKEHLLDEEDVLDIVAGPDSYRDLPNLVNDVFNGNKAVNTSLSSDETYADIVPSRVSKNKISAFISIMRGCENFCSYCVVPFTRGKERSRSPQSILEEAENLVKEGYKEITLLGQNVNSYSWKENTTIIDFPDLIEKVAALNSNLRIRFATSHPKDLSEKLIKIIAANENICRSIHLPIQSGSDSILDKMNRKYNSSWYLGRIELIKKHIPDCAISTDIIAGFCGETEADHQATLRVMEEVGYEFAFMFKYSERLDTTAAKKYTDDISEEIKVRRLNEIIAMQQKQSLLSNEHDIGKTFKVLVEGVSKRSKDFYYGRSSQNKVIIFPIGAYTSGDYILVKVNRCTSATLFGELV